MSEITAAFAAIPPRRGRRLRADTPSVPVPIRFSQAELQRLKSAAHANNQRVSDFARDAIVTAADDCLDPIS